MKEEEEEANKVVAAPRRQIMTKEKSSDPSYFSQLIRFLSTDYVYYFKQEM
jgi:hypothetical protein